MRRVWREPGRLECVLDDAAQAVVRLVMLTREVAVLDASGRREVNVRLGEERVGRSEEVDLGQFFYSSSQAVFVHLIDRHEVGCEGLPEFG
jgi:hypothetical protein